MKIPNRHFMTIGSGVHTANQANVIDDIRGVGQQLGNLCSTFAMLAKLKWTAQEFLAGLIHETELHFSRIISAGELRQFWLGISQIHVRRATMLKQRNHSASLRLSLRYAWL